ncbi:hypothetical protein BK809_0000266 [Diplodia seriata]|uniref:Uncharacterized protein n=1 Tax=Diplodia seriata TaxID=420778 RepID=A0A1S8BCB4_9PEZI|nr:hypothetical protein BK809_0000266 [Diplodia seriata]
MMSCFGIVIRTWWSEIARAIHTMEPYRRIALGRASAHSSILAPTSPHAIAAIFSSLRRRHFFPAYLSLLAVLSEILIVTLASVPFHIATLLEAFRVSVFVSVGIVGLMVVTLPAVWVYCRGAAVGPPVCVADTVMMLMGREDGEGGNEVAGVLGGMGGLRRSERDKAIEGLGRRYRMVGVRGGGKEVAGMRIAFERDECVA